MSKEKELNTQDHKENDEGKKPVALMKSMKRILALGRPWLKRLVTALLLTILASGIGLAVPLGLRELLDAVFEEGNRQLLNQLTIGLFVLFLFQAITTFVGQYQLSWVGERVVADLRMKLYAQLNRLGLRFFSDQRLGDITSRLTNDVSSVRSAVTDSLSSLFTQSFSLIGSLILMLILNWRLSLIVFVVVPVATLGSRYFGVYIRRLSREIQDLLANTTAIAEETLSSVRVVKAFAREPFEIKRYNTAVEGLFEASRHMILVQSIFWAIIGLVFFSALVTVFWYGGTEVLAGRLTAGDLVAFIFYAFNIARSVGTMSRLYTSFNSAAGASERLFELLDLEPEIKELPNAPALPAVVGALKFDDVSFAYDEDAIVLKDLNFEVSAGETIALVGPSGAGKSTLINLIPRFYDATSGSISIDGHQLDQVQTASIRQQIGIVPQDIDLFGSSLGENIRYGRLEAAQAEIETAAKDANIHEFIAGLPDGYDTTVGEKGVKLSGGQRQRVAIARAILKDPQILLLDEATSALDSVSEFAVQQALNKLMQNRTTFIIAHRLSTVQHADRILVIEDGKIIEEGTHETLYAQDGLYKELCDLQFQLA